MHAPSDAAPVDRNTASPTILLGLVKVSRETGRTRGEARPGFYNQPKTRDCLTSFICTSWLFGNQNTRQILLHRLCAGKICNLNRKYFFQLLRLTRLLAWALMQNCGSDWVAAIFVGKVSRHERCNKRHRPGHVGTNDWLLMGVALSGVNKTSFFLFEHS